MATEISDATATAAAPRPTVQMAGKSLRTPMVTPVSGV